MCASSTKSDRLRRFSTTFAFSLFAFSAACLAKAEGHALLVGLNGNPAVETKLQYAEDDAKLLAASLLKLEGFEEKNITVLVGRQATQKRLNLELKRLADRVKPGDTVFFCFSGNGVDLAGVPHGMLLDSQWGDNDKVRATWFSMAEAQNSISSTQAGLVITLFDACRNEVDHAYLERQRFKPKEQIIKESSAGRTRLHFTSSLPDQTAFEVNGKGGVGSWSLASLMNGTSPTSLLSLSPAAIVDSMLFQVGSVSGERQDCQAVLTGALGTRPCLTRSADARRTSDVEKRDAASLFQTAMQLIEEKSLNEVSDVEAAYSLQLLREAEKLGGTSSKIKLHMGRCNDRLGRDLNAERLYKDALQLDPTNAWALNNLGILQAGMRNDFNAAEASYRKAIEADPSFESAYSNLGDLLANVKDNPVEAEAIYKKGIEAAPKKGTAYVGLSRLYIKLGRTSDLEKLKEEAARNGVTITP